MQNGVGGHAGLFGDAYSVAALMQMYLQGGYYNRVSLIKNLLLIYLTNHITKTW